MSLPLDDFIDYKKLGMKQVQPNKSIVKNEQSCLKICVKDMTSFESMLAPNPNRDIIEDRRQGDTIKEFVSLVLARTKMFLYYVEWFLQVETFVHHFEYPRFSNFCYVSLMLFIYSFDS